jgi:hypothetical protein
MSRDQRGRLDQGQRRPDRRTQLARGTLSALACPGFHPPVLVERQAQAAGPAPTLAAEATPPAAAVAAEAEAEAEADHGDRHTWGRRPIGHWYAWQFKRPPRSGTRRTLRTGPYVLLFHFSAEHCQAHGIGDMGAFDPSAHALSVTVGHSRPGRGVTGWLAGQRVAGGSRSSGGCRHRVKNGRR